VVCKIEKSWQFLDIARNEKLETECFGNKGITVAQADRSPLGRSG